MKFLNDEQVSLFLQAKALSVTADGMQADNMQAVANAGFPKYGFDDFNNIAIGIEARADAITKMSRTAPIFEDEMQTQTIYKVVLWALAGFVSAGTGYILAKLI